MHVGGLRDRVRFVAPAVQTDALGGQSTSWGSVATVWGRWRALTGREVVQGQAVQSTTTHRVVVRFRTDITVKMRATLLPTGPTCDITALRDVDGRRRELELDLVEVL